MPKVSVVIPTYNYAQFLGEAIQSVLDQSFRDFEVIVIDDGSNDNTAEVVSAFPVRYFYQENQGLPAARNRGAELTQSEYIIFLDSDDILMEDALEKSVDMLDSHPQVGFSYGQALVFDDESGIYGVIKSSFLNDSAVVDGKEQLKELVFFSNRMQISSVMVRRKCFNEVAGFHEGMKRFQDHHFCIKLAKRYPVAYIAKPLIKYRIHPNNIHQNVDPKLAEQVWLQILCEVIEDPSLNTYFQPYIGQVYSQYYLRIAKYAYGKDMKLSRHYLWQAIRAYPRMLAKRDSLSIIYRYAQSFLPTKVWLVLRTFKRHFVSPRRPMEGKACPK